MNYVVAILEEFLNTHKRLNEETGQVSFDCPACSDDKGMPEGDGKGNLEINYNKDVFKCWVCKGTNDMSGPVSKLIRRYGNPRILKDYRQFKPEIQTEDRPKTILTLPDGFKLIKNSNSRDFKYNRVIKYLTDRGITPDIIEKYNIGYTTSDEKYFNRIIIPSYDENGFLNYFIARWFDRQYTKMKYRNPDAKKQEIIFNENIINWDATIYLVEGGFDHIVVPNSIPLLGKLLYPLLIKKLHDKAKANIVILLDGDAPEDAENLYNELDVGSLSGRIRLCTLPDGLDPSLVYQKWGREGIKHILRIVRKLDNQK